jgi:hypothetical protein
MNVKLSHCSSHSFKNHSLKKQFFNQSSDHKNINKLFKNLIFQTFSIEFRSKIKRLSLYLCYPAYNRFHI